MEQLPTGTIIDRNHAGALSGSETVDLTGENENLASQFEALFEENVLAKPFRTAIQCLKDSVPAGFPEIVPQEGENFGKYQLQDPNFWTCGFFPGILFALLERCVKYPQRMAIRDEAGLELATIRSQLAKMCDIWAEPLHAMASRTDTHDLGFMIMPALRRHWELTGSQRSLDTITKAARSLATRYVPEAKAIRSWDKMLKKNSAITDVSENMLVIVDSLCNLDLLFYAAAHAGEASLAEVAATHARTLVQTHLRPETVPLESRARNAYRGQLYSTCHVANLDPSSGEIKWRGTHQGYSDNSTWSRGQAWAVLGYTQTFKWTGDEQFLEVACGTAEFFLHELESAPACVDAVLDEAVPAPPPAEGSKERRTAGRYVPLWDFSAPIEDPTKPLRDTSAGVIASNGMLLLSQALASRSLHSLSRRFFDGAVAIMRDTISLSLAHEKAFLSGQNDAQGRILVKDVVMDGVMTFDGILKNATVNNHEFALRRYGDHGLVYADYYFVEFGNRLLQMGFV